MSISLVESIQSDRPRWQPKTWRVEYDRIVGYSAAGLANTEIAEKLNFTKEYVSLILNLPQAKQLYARIRANVAAKLEEDIPTRLQKIAEKAIGRMEQMIEDDVLFEKNPFSVIDRGMDVLKGIGYIRGGGNGAAGPGDSIGNTTNITILSANQKSDLMDGFEKIKEVQRLHSGKKESE